MENLLGIVQSLYPGFQDTSSADFDDLILDLAGNGGFIYRATSRYS